MPLTVQQFARRLTAVELFTRSELDEFASALPSSPADGEELAKALVKSGRLTPYQARTLYAGDGKTLLLGNYVIQDKLGEGGMGEVYLARHRRLRRDVALKILPGKLTDNPDAVRRFHREVQAIAKLSHPNIVGAFDADESNGTHYFVMEYAAGEDLSSLVKKNGPLGVIDAIECIQQAAAGLGYAHEQGVVHRDIKPSNLLMASGGRQPADHVDSQTAPSSRLRTMLASSTIKILDLGLARFEQTGNENTQTELTSTGAVMGTVDYMAPEQALNTRNADARSDIYSLGCTLHYLLTGRPVYNGETIIARVLAHRDSPIPDLIQASSERQSADGVDDRSTSSAGIRPILASLQPVFETMVAKHPGDRYQSMAEVVDALQRVKTGALAAATAETAAGTDLELRQFLDTIDEPSTKTFDDAPAKAPPPAEETSTDKLPRETLAVTSEASFTLGLTKRPKKTWRDYLHDRNVQIFGGGVILVLVATVLAAMFLGDSGNGEPEDDSAGNPNPTRSTPSYALQFNGGFDHVEIPTLHFEKHFLRGYTVEFHVSGHQPFGSQMLFDSFGKGGRIRVFHTSTKVAQWVGTLYREGPDHNYTVNGTPGVNAKRHIAFVCTDATCLLFLDGKLLSSRPTKWVGPARKLTVSYLGQNPADGERRSYRGRIHGVRVSNRARYAGSFAPPIQLQMDEHTVALYNMRQGSGAKLTDDSGNGHHGVIHGATWVRADGKPIQKPASTADDIDRQVARWARGVSTATIGIEFLSDRQRTTVRMNDAIPRQRFQITDLTLDQPGRMAAEDVRRLATLAKLNGLTISRAGSDTVPWEAISELKQIGRLHFTHTIVDDGNIAHIAKLRSLTDLWLTSRDQLLTAAGIVYLNQLSKLRSLGISNLRMADDSMRIITSLPNLLHLTLDNVPLADKSLKHLSSSRNLGQLILINNKLSNEGFANIPPLPRLYDLRLIGNAGITGEALPRIEKFPGLKIVNLTGTGVKRQEAVAFQRKHLGVKVYWGGKSLRAGDVERNLALHFDGKDDHIRVPKLRLATVKALTIEAVVSHYSAGGRQTLVRLTDRAGFAELEYSAGRWEARTFRSGQGFIRRHAATAKTSGAPVHLACVWDGSRVRLFVNGVESTANPDKIVTRRGKGGKTRKKRGTRGAKWVKAQGLSIGGVHDSQYFTGRLHRVRVSRSARYTKNFKPPGRFVTDHQTQALYELEEGEGDQLKDSSGNSHHGVIHGATWVKGDSRDSGR